MRCSVVSKVDHGIEDRGIDRFPRERGLRSGKDCDAMIGDDGVDTAVVRVGIVFQCVDTRGIGVCGTLELRGDTIAEIPEVMGGIHRAVVEGERHRIATLKGEGYRGKVGYRLRTESNIDSVSSFADQLSLTVEDADNISYISTGLILGLNGGRVLAEGFPDIGVMLGGCMTVGGIEGSLVDTTES